MFDVVRRFLPHCHCGDLGIVCLQLRVVEWGHRGPLADLRVGDRHERRENVKKGYVIEVVRTIGNYIEIY